MRLWQRQPTGGGLWEWTLVFAELIPPPPKLQVREPAVIDAPPPAGG